MQDKILVIMGLVEDYHEYGHHSYKDAIESKLRKLVREPLDAHEVGSLVETAAYLSTEHQRRADFINGIRYAERAHGITNGSGVG